MGPAKFLVNYLPNLPIIYCYVNKRINENCHVRKNTQIDFL